MYLSERLEGLLADFQPDPAHINTNLSVSCRQLFLLLPFLHLLLCIPSVFQVSQSDN